MAEGGEEGAKGSEEGGGGSMGVRGRGIGAVSVEDAGKAAIVEVTTEMEVRLRGEAEVVEEGVVVAAAGERVMQREGGGEGGGVVKEVRELGVGGQDNVGVVHDISDVRWVEEGLAHQGLEGEGHMGEGPVVREGDG